MAVKTTLEQLESVQSAITAIESGAQSVTIDGKRIDRGQLDILYAREEKLNARYLTEQRGGMRIRGGTPT